MPLASTPRLQLIDLSKADGPTDAPVVIVPLPKNTTAIVFGQRTAQFPQRYNTYVVDTDNTVIDPQAIWDAPSDNSRFLISKIIPQNFAQDPTVLSIGPSNEDRNIVIHCCHKRPDAREYTESDPQYDYYEFKIGGKNAITFTMINAEDGGDSDYHDTVVGVAVSYLTK